MPKDIKEFIEKIRYASPEILEDTIDELLFRISHRDIFIFEPLEEIKELIYSIREATEKGFISKKYLARVIKGIINFIRAFPLSSVERNFLSGLLRRELILAIEPEKGKMLKKKSKKEEVEKIAQSLEKVELNEQDTILFFLGAGASKPSPSNIPTINELLKTLWEKSNRLETKPLEKLQQWCRENNIENIEELLTAVTISNFIIKNSKVHGFLNSVLYPEWSQEIKNISIRNIDSILLLDNMLNTFFSLLVGTMLEAKPNEIHNSIAEYAKNIKPGFVNILTTNYDICIDQALDNYHVKYNYILNASEDKNSLNLVKIHGSINWFYCETCQNIFLPSIETITDAIKKEIPYSVLGMCQHCNAPTKQFIIPPITYKYLTHPLIIQIWDYGRKIFEQAKIIVIVGYSFSVAEDYISKMLAKAINKDPQKNIIIIDINEEAIDRCKSCIKFYVESFDDSKHFFPLLGDGVEFLPKVVDILKKKTKSIKLTNQKVRKNIAYSKKKNQKEKSD